MDISPSIRIVDAVAAQVEPIHGDAPTSWRRRPVASLDREQSRYVVYDPRAVAVVRCGPHHHSPLTDRLRALGYRPLDVEPAVWWRPRAAQHAAAA